MIRQALLEIMVALAVFLTGCETVEKATRTADAVSERLAAAVEKSAQTIESSTKAIAQAAETVSQNAAKGAREVGAEATWNVREMVEYAVYAMFLLLSGLFLRGKARERWLERGLQELKTYVRERPDFESVIRHEFGKRLARAGKNVKREFDRVEEL